MNPQTPISLTISLALAAAACGSSLTERLTTIHEGFLKERRIALASLSDPFGIPQKPRKVLESQDPWLVGWKDSIAATVFWIGEEPTENNPTPNNRSAWDQNWEKNFGGYDDPNNRKGYQPAGFTPRHNQFYVALPYNDLLPDGSHRPEAPEMIPWFWRSYMGKGISVCKGRWISIRHGNKTCYAQWEDVGPFEVDHWQYVFGNENPRPNRNGNAGIDLSPAVRDYLGITSGTPISWRFVENEEVPHGPWVHEKSKPSKNEITLGEN
jgi:hypothetical protein